MLADEVVSLLSDEKSSVSSALLKTKVFLHEIGKKELATWVDYELRGYPDNVELPDYRVIDAIVMGELASRFTRENRMLALGHLTLEQKRKFETVELRESLKIIEEMSSQIQGKLQLPFAPEFTAGLNKYVNTGWSLLSAWQEPNQISVKDVVVQVRSRLLDFMLNLKEAVEEKGETEINRANTSSVNVRGIFERTVFHGDVIMNFGDNSSQSVIKTVTTNDFETLKRKFSDIGVPADEIEKLKEAVEEDEANGTKDPDGSAGRWLASLVAKASSGTIKIAANVVMTVGMKALAAYYGYHL